MVCPKLSLQVQISFLEISMQGVNGYLRTKTACKSRGIIGIPMVKISFSWSCESS